MHEFMPPASTNERLDTNGENIAFYNEIADNYDIILDQENSNAIVRQRVKEKFTGIVAGGWVLDFGGGTGRDLDWLTENNYHVVFCEPSEGMRQKAIGRYAARPLISHVTFLNNDQVDFATWHTQAPFSTKMDAIISDFAVFNCIADIDLLYKNLARVLKPGGHLVALVLNHKYKKTWRWKLREFLRSIISRKPVMKNIQYKDHRQTVYFHSHNQNKNASAAYFELRSTENLFEFTLIHFVKK
jgi:SAM-dependent methyltransferase